MYSDLNPGAKPMEVIEPDQGDLFEVGGNYAWECNRARLWANKHCDQLHQGWDQADRLNLLSHLRNR